MTAQTFTYEPHPARVVFGPGSRRSVGAEAERLGIRRALLIASARHGEEVTADLGGVVAARFKDAVMHVPAAVAARALDVATRARCDGLVALGGGSPIGLAKAVARETGLPIVAVPTTYSGSEMTSVWGLTDEGGKRTGRDARVRPKTVIYDPELLVSLPRAVAGPSALNAIAHAMEALYAADVDPVTEACGEEGVARIAASLPPLMQRCGLEDASGVLCGAWLAGTCLDRTTMGLHHKLCHVLGGSFGLPHAPLHALLAPYSAAFNRAAAPRAMGRLARALGSDDPVTGLRDLARKAGAPASLAALGLKESELDRAADVATRDAYPNPRPPSRASVRKLLQSVYEGAPPGDASID